MHYKPIRLLILILILFSFFTETNIESSELDTIIAGTEIGDNLITSGKGFLTYEYIYVDSINALTDFSSKFTFFKYIKSEIFFAFKGPKTYCDEKTITITNKGEKIISQGKRAYNGEKTDILLMEPTGPKGLIELKGIIESENSIDFHYDPRYGGINLFITPTNIFIKNKELCVNKENVNNLIFDDVTLIGEEVLDDILCKVFHGHNDTHNVNVWLAPDMMYRPLKYELISLSGETVVSNKFKEHSNGIWFPNEMKFESYVKESGEKILKSIRTLIINDDFEINGDISDSLFELNFPEGLAIYDIRKH